MTKSAIDNSIEYYHGQGYLSKSYKGITKDQQMVSTSAHEMEHNLDPKSRESIKARQEGRTVNYDVEKPAYKISDAVYKEVQNE